MKEEEQSPASTDQAKAAADQENPLANIMVNILIPVIALSWLSKDGDVTGKAWHVGPVYGMIIAVLLPTVYFIWHFIKTRKVNFYSILGAAGVMLTGSITWYAWNTDGTIKENAALLFAIKEAAIPLLFGITILYSHWTTKPLVGVFLLNPDLLDISRIESAARDNNQWDAYQKIRWQGTWMLAGSLLLSAALNFFLAIYLLSGKADPVSYNAAVGKLTWVGFLVIGIPLMAIMISGLFLLIRKISQVTGLPREEVFLPR
ncbi:MAG: VC0807 family protein [Verrucomicrobiota bacterium]|nr:VC0807 family protein [Verrucomicrobiota bacterium]